MIIEKDHFSDSLYLIIITISTVGFGLPHELTDGGKVLTFFLIIFSFGKYAYVKSIIASYLVHLETDNVLGIKSNKNRKKMKDHVILSGFGRNGQRASSMVPDFRNYVLGTTEEIDKIKKQVK